MSRIVYRDTALQRLKETYKGDGKVLPALERHVMKQMTQDVRPADHSLQFMHPSDMVKKDWCGRHDYYRILGTPTESASQANPSFRMENIFAEGNAIAGKYTQWLWEMGVLFGDWECRECGHRYGALSPAVCQFCRSPRLTYREVPMRRVQMMVEGHADGAVHGLGGWDGLIEIKSIGIGTLRFEAPRLYNRYQDGESIEEIWWKINRPFNTHLKQGQLYLWMAWPRYEEIAFIYESKVHQQTKEFVVSYDKSVISGILETAKEVSQGVRAGIPPDRPLWAAPEGKVCKSCSYRKTCWGIDDDTQENGVQRSVVLVQRAKPGARNRSLLKAGVRAS